MVNTNYFNANTVEMITRWEIHGAIFSIHNFNVIVTDKVPACFYYFSILYFSRNGNRFID